ncbi:MAG: type II toxin-antitoxin system PemK/MazF family toxin [Methanothrix sp.]|nr:MAG: type II toxin-antitoxin system PemK/MazF family toxin [Methanothrix sp.]
MPEEPLEVPKGSIVLVDFPFTDLFGAKLRPALVLYEGYLDVTAAAITSEIPQKLLPTDLLIFQRTPSFEGTGLKEDSIILIDKIATIEKTFIKGILGEANADLRRRVNTKIAQFLMFDDGPANGL